MFVFVPLGVEGGQVRFPVVGAGILATCLVLFIVTYAAVPDPLGQDRAVVKEVVEYLVEHPYLEVPRDFARHFLPEAALHQLEALKGAWLAENTPPTGGVLEEEQAELERMAAAAIAAIRPTLFTRLALVKARGVAQVGWLTHMFLHFGWLHLVGNMLFLYAVALLLEDAWGRGLFLAFYLAGGLLSAVAEFALHGDSAMVMGGASGAVSACIGAAVVRFARRRMRLGYFLFLGIIRTGTFAVPVWLWGLFKAGGEVLDLATGATAGVAVVAHVAGLSFGALVALVMRGAGLDKRFVASDEVTDPYRNEELPAVVEAQALAKRGQTAEARARLLDARRQHPDDLEVMWALMGLDLLEGQKVQAAAWLERQIQTLLRAGHQELAAQRFLGAWPSFTAEDLRPSFAWQLLRTWGEGGLSLDVARALAKRAGSERSAVAPHAWVRAAELGLQARDLDDAAQCLAQARAHGGSSRELSARIDELSQRLGPASHGVPLEDAAPHHPDVAPPVGARPVQVGPRRQRFRAAVRGARQGVLELALPSGATRSLPLAEIKAVGAGLVSEAAGRKVLVMVLVLRAEDAPQPALLVQLDSDTAGVERLRPGMPPREAYLEFLRWLLSGNAAAAPSRGQLEAGQLSTFSDAGALEFALFPP